jgi:hypothetical protein
MFVLLFFNAQFTKNGMFCQYMPAENFFNTLKAETNPKSAMNDFVDDKVLLLSSLEG